MLNSYGIIITVNYYRRSGGLKGGYFMAVGLDQLDNSF